MNKLIYLLIASLLAFSTARAETPRKTAYAVAFKKIRPPRRLPRHPKHAYGRHWRKEWKKQTEDVLLTGTACRKDSPLPKVVYKSSALGLADQLYITVEEATGILPAVADINRIAMKLCSRTSRKTSHIRYRHAFRQRHYRSRS